MQQICFGTSHGASGNISTVTMYPLSPRKQSVTPALASIMRSKRVQFLPVQWRTGMKYDLDRKGPRDGLDNHFTLSDITPKGTIPSVLIIFSVDSRQDSSLYIDSFESLLIMC